MPLKNIFSKDVGNHIVDRINKLTSASSAKWGKMSVAQMLAHCNVTYEMIYDDIHPKPNAFLKFILKMVIKSKVTGETTYPHNSKTAPQFIIKETKDFDLEKQRLISFFNKTQQLGENYFDGRESHSFGKLTKTEWSNMLYKHLEHHLTQFGV